MNAKVDTSRIWEVFNHLKMFVFSKKIAQSNRNENSNNQPLYEIIWTGQKNKSVHRKNKSQVTKQMPKVNNSQQWVKSKWRSFIEHFEQPNVRHSQPHSWPNSHPNPRHYNTSSAAMAQFSGGRLLTTVQNPICIVYIVKSKSNKAFSSDAKSRPSHIPHFNVQLGPALIRCRNTPRMGIAKPSTLHLFPLGKERV